MITYFVYANVCYDHAVRLLKLKAINCVLIFAINESWNTRQLTFVRWIKAVDGLYLFCLFTYSFPRTTALTLSPGS